MCSGMIYNHIEILISTVRLSTFRIFTRQNQAGQAVADRWTGQLLPWIASASKDSRKLTASR
jgi:hypothetical protein